MAEPLLTIFNNHTATCGAPPSLRSDSPDLYVGYYANRFGEQWIFTFNHQTREACLRGGDIGWEAVHTVCDGRVDGIILSEEETAWLRACWRAACT